ncbi:MAG: isoleucine--tRNA ligase [Candidatus Anstonellales archaeon]
MYDHKEVEEWSERFWQENNIYSKIKGRGTRRFEFIDGPPFVTGEIHPGTAWNKCIKDSILRFYRMRGYDVNDTPGFDTHGLPIEVKVEKKLGIENKGEIESRIGIEKFIKECKDFAEQYRNIMTQQLKRFHIWMDWDRPYITFKKEYIERSWKTIKRAWDKGLLKEGDYVVPYCYRCQTTLANYELEYKDLEDPSIYVMFPTFEDGKYLLIWTTTPWTLVANLAIMVNPNEIYLEIERDGKILIVAKKRFENNSIFRDWYVRREFLGKELEGLRYKHPFDDLLKFKFDRKVVLSEEFVSMEDGTGLVHSAPGHGEEDFKVGQRYGLPTFSFVDDEGKYIDIGDRFKGRLCRDMNSEIIEILKERGLLFRRETIKHSYPTCWRCKSPLIYRSTHQWFITITNFRDRMIEEAKGIKWVPNFAMKRFVNFLQNSPDWCISRQRYWGIPLPIWKCDRCGNVKVIDKIPDGLEDPHRPYIDQIVFKCDKCGGEMHRVPDVLDVWFDSGNAVWASTGKDVVADFIVEGQDQIRGWFYSLLGSGMIYYNKIPYRAVAMHGFFVDEKGEKMSKSVGNYVPVEEILERVGADAFRLFGLSNNIWEDLKFNWRDLELAKRELFVTLNIAKYLEDNHKSLSYVDMKIWDKWLVARLNELKKVYIDSFQSYEYYIAVRALREFIIEDLSRFYMKIVKTNPSSLGTLYHVFLEVLTMLAPITPATAEYIYQKLYRKHHLEESIFMRSIGDAADYDSDLLRNMQRVRGLISEILEWRQREKINLRMPIQEVIISDASLYPFREIIADMINAKEISFNKPESSDLSYDGIEVRIIVGNLVDEWLYNEISRRIQFYRKQLGLKKDETIQLLYDGSDAIVEIIDKFKSELAEKTRAELVRNVGLNDGIRYSIKDMELILKKA